MSLTCAPWFCSTYSVARPPLLLFVLWFVFSIIHGNGRATKNGKGLPQFWYETEEWRKTGKAWEHLSHE